MTPMLIHVTLSPYYIYDDYLIFILKTHLVLICLLGCFSTANLTHLIYPYFGMSILPNKIKETRVIIIIHDNYKEKE